MDASLSVKLKRLEAEIRQILRRTDFDLLSSKERRLLADLQQDLIDALKYTSSYELSETRAEQLDNAKTAKTWLGKVKKCILSASESNIFGPVDVASLSAGIEQIIDRLE